MSIFKNFFGENSEKENGKSLWKYLETEADLAEATEKSYQKKVVIFKHSTRCMISKTVLKNFEKEIAANPEIAEFYFLDLLKHRNLSNKIAEHFSVTHQSPQILVLEKGIAVKNASHDHISASLI